MSTPLPSTPLAAVPRRVQALDGLRGFALLGMLAWHAQIGWVKGGFARMTIFFVLSGFLAASSWLSLTAKGVDKPFGTFWRRRARRLLPITVLGVAFATVVTAMIGSHEAVGDLRGDAGSVLAGVSNWRFLLDDQSYGALFERPSAFQHFWSLSLEEQSFWLLPLVIAGVVAVAGRRAWMAVIGLAVGLAALPALISHSPDAAYYGTHVRGGEFLAGVALAMVLARNDGSVPVRWHRPVAVVGAVGLASLVLVMLTIERDHDWLYAGGLGLFALPAVAVVLAARLHTGPVPWVLGLAPLAFLGRAAFSIYVLHWPLFQLLETERTGLDGPALAAVQLAVGIGVGSLVYLLLERRLIEQPLPDRWALPTLASIGVAVVLVAGLVPPPAAPYDLLALQDRLAAGFDLDLDQARHTLETSPARPTPPPVDASLVAAPPEPARVGLFGGSTAVAMGAAATGWDAASPGVELAPGYARLGCGIVTEGHRVHGLDATGQPALARPDDWCLGWEVRWPAAAVAQDLDVAVLMTGVWETASWQLDGTPELAGIDAPDFHDLVELKLAYAVQSLQARGIAVVLATTPVVGGGFDGLVHDRRALGPEHAARVLAFNDIVHRVTANHPGVMVVPYGELIDGLPAEVAAEQLPDGIHPTEAAAADLWSTSVGPALLTVVEAAARPAS